MAEVIWALAGVLAGAALATVVLRARRGAGPAPAAAAEPPAAGSGGGAAAQAKVLGSLPDGVVLFEPDGGAGFVSEAARTLLGAAPADRAQLMPLQVREAVDRASAGAASDVVVETGSPGGWLRAIAIPAADDGSVLLVVRDVTEARRLDAVRRDFVTNASHELKTPAASIQALAETLGHAIRDEPAAATRFVDRLEAEATRLARIVTELLDLSRLEAGETSTEPVDLAEIVREETGRFADRARRQGVALDVAAEGPVTVVGSREDLSLLVRNLVDNALGASPRTAVRVAATSGGDGASLTVADDGIGIPTKDLPRIFERFYRVDRARSREAGGTGLGLAIVKHVAENLGGTVSVRSELGRGTEFEVGLPIA